MTHPSTHGRSVGGAGGFPPGCTEPPRCAAWWARSDDRCRGQSWTVSVESVLCPQQAWGSRGPRAVRSVWRRPRA